MKLKFEFFKFHVTPRPIQEKRENFISFMTGFAEFLNSFFLVVKKTKKGDFAAKTVFTKKHFNFNRRSRYILGEADW